MPAQNTPKILPLKVAMQMDPIEDVNIDADSSFRIAEEAQARGHKIYYYAPDDLRFEAGIVSADLTPITLRREVGNHVTKGTKKLTDLREMDVIWLRQDPPFDMHYITNTHLLENLRDDVLVVNDPFWVRNFPEKLLVLDFQDLTPPTMIARNIDAIKDFRERHGDIIVKPLYGNGGAGVFKIKKDDSNLNSLFELFTATSREPLIAQQFLPDVSAGDKRIILVDGEPVGAINRVPAKGETRSNMHVGGRPEKIGLTKRDMEICARIGPFLKEHGQIFVGIDVIGDFLTEINVTSPTGIQEMERFDGTNIAEKIWQAIEAKCG